MPNALILHGTSGSPQENWFQWLKQQLENRGWTVWIPELPNSEAPNMRAYLNYLQNSNWEFSKDSIIIGHSSGAVAILGLLQNIATDLKIDSCYLVGAFKNDLGWDSLRNLFQTPFDYEHIKTKARQITLIHSDDDPYCPLEHAKYLSQKLDAKLIIKQNQQHFSVSTAGESYTKFPFLLDLVIKNR